MASSTRPRKHAARASNRRAEPGSLGCLRRRRGLAVGLAAICLVALASAGYFVIYPEGRAWYYWRQAEWASTEGDFARARNSLRNCVQVWSKSGELHFALARACRRDGDFPEARAELLLARQYHWPAAALDLETKLIQAQSGGVRPVEGFLQACLESGHEDSPLIREALTLGYLQNNYLADAEPCLVAWQKQYPHMWQPHHFLAAVHERRHRAPLAVAEYQRVLELKPNQADARYQLASLLILSTKQFGEALPHFRAYVGLRPEDPAGQVGLGRCQRALRLWAAAEASAANALQLQANHAEALQLQGLLAWDQDRLAEALERLRQADQIAPHEVETKAALARVLHELGRDQEAAPYEQRRLELERELRRLADVLHEVHDLESRREPALGKQTIARRREVAAIYFRMGDEIAGLSWLLSALQESPDDPETRRLVAEMQARMKSAEATGQRDPRPYLPAMPRGLGEPFRPR